MSDEKAAVRRTALHDRHVRAGGKMVPFAGWEMPVQYTSIIEEHTAVRERVGLFDVSHMGEIHLTGPRRVEEAERLTTARIADKEIGEVQYAILPTEEGGIVDDILVYKLEDLVLLVVNASNREKDFRWIASRIGSGAAAVDASQGMSQIAIQGKRARDVLGRVAGPEATSLGYYKAIRARVAGVESIVSRTGYTGELGFEVYAPWDAGPRIWDALMEAGRGDGIVPVGLGARDSLRLEMRYCLYGNDIDESTNPYEAGIGWVVRKKDAPFVGKEALAAVRKAGLRRKLVGFRLGARDIPRHGYAILSGGEEVGSVTSGGFSPTLRAGIALGYVAAAAAGEADGFSIRIRGRETLASRQDGSFVPSSVKDEGEDAE
ncbi:MAG: glycine cleavage system aminomethyltransferase GcvT [Candidatus Latescibacterota bacterium]|nr:MAG: glycine cleavage system aminomethyltransferase GcvT [Candidatus Latescibacterota bacterium]